MDVVVVARTLVNFVADTGPGMVAQVTVMINTKIKIR